MHKFIVDIDITGINVFHSIDLFYPVPFMDVPENMDLRLDFLYELQQSLAACFVFANREIQDIIRRPMSDQHIDVFRNSPP